LASTSTPRTSGVCEPHGDAASGFAFGGAKPVAVDPDYDADGKPECEDDALLVLGSGSSSLVAGAGVGGAHGDVGLSGTMSLCLDSVVAALAAAAKYPGLEVVGVARDGMAKAEYAGADVTDSTFTRSALALLSSIHPPLSFFLSFFLRHCFEKMGNSCIAASTVGFRR